MKFHPISTILPLALLCFFGAACTGSKLPDGMPSLVPCTIIITQDGKPLSDANVSLLPEEDSGSKWNAAGSTDAAGKALMYTWGSHEGVAPGKYKVTVKKLETEKLPPAPSGAATPPKTPETFSLVEDHYGTVGSTTLNAEIAKGTKEYTFDVGTAVKNLVPKTTK